MRPMSLEDLKHTVETLWDSDSIRTDLDLFASIGNIDEMFI